MNSYETKQRLIEPIDWAPVYGFFWEHLPRLPSGSEAFRSLPRMSKKDALVSTGYCVYQVACTFLVGGGVVGGLAALVHKALDV